MRVLSNLTGRVLQFINLDEFTPTEGIYGPDLVRSITERYAFAVSPASTTPWVDVLNNGLKFETGRLTTKSGIEVIQDFIIFNNGLSVSAHTTDAASLFIEDVLEFATTSLRFRARPDFRRQVFLSEIVVSLERSIDLAIQRFESLSNLFLTMTNETYGCNLQSMHLSSLKLDWDRLNVPSDLELLAHFAIERRLNHPFTDQAYFCRAPLQTRRHIRLLEQFELLVSA